MVGHKYAVAVTSNSHGQDLVLKALDIKDGDIINPTISFMTTAMIPMWNNCSTNVVDVDPVNLNPAKKLTSDQNYFFTHIIHLG